VGFHLWLVDASGAIALSSENGRAIVNDQLDA
jgi:hypothetical protein